MGIKHLLPWAIALGGSLCGGCQAATTQGLGSAPELALDEDSNVLKVALPAASGRAVTHSHAFGNVVLDGVCGGRIDGTDYAFTFADDGYLAQWRINPVDGTISPVRELPGSLGVEACVVDGHSLYILEEVTGLWHYGAHPESDPERTLVELFAPRGRIPADSEELALVDGALIVGGARIRLPAKSAMESRALPVVQASTQTDPVGQRGDAADDATIWRNAQAPDQSLVLAADKRYGLRIYNLGGRETASIAAGRINNVDLRDLQGHPTFAALAAGSNRSLKSISLFAIEHGGKVRWLRNSEIATGLGDPYGLCMMAGAEQLSVFINDKDGRFQQWQLAIDKERVDAQLVREFRVDDQPEGCTVDDANQRLFLGIEDRGVLSMATSGQGQPDLVPVASVDGENLFADVEGMDIYFSGDAGYLVVSSQGDNSYAVYDRQPPHRYRGSFRVIADSKSGIDGTSETDGLAIHEGSFDDAYPMGLMVVQDGHNVAPAANQNFKLIDWQTIEAILEL